MYGQTVSLYALPCKYHEAELVELAATLRSYIDRRTERHGVSFPVLVQDLESAQFLVTKLVQSQRLKRELRKLRPEKPIIVVQHAWLIKTLETDVVINELLLRRDAWCLYCPAAEMYDRNEVFASSSRDHPCTVSQGFGQESLTSQNSSRDDSEAAKLRAGKAGESLSSADTLSDKLPSALLRRESTTDPSGKSFHGVAVTPLAIKKYACQRRTPLQTPNDGLISKFQLMRLARELQCDSVGERAYSTIVASLKAVPFVIRSVNDIEGLEGCGSKTINLIQEYINTGTIREVDEVWQDEALKTLHTFWNCHGVGAATAHAWYYVQGYRDLNDAIQNWDALARPVQIGLKYYDDFQVKLSRKEVEDIADFVTKAAQSVVNRQGSQGIVSSTICGGYRRGKLESGDVDILICHETLYSMETLLTPLLTLLEELKFLKVVISAHHSGTSIALVVVRLPSASSQVYRRLDIIVCHPRCYITAITGWTGTTTLERDLRLYTSRIKRWRFDSTGLSDEVTRERIEHESFVWKSGLDVEVLEKSFFQFLGLEYIPPLLRCA